MTDVNEVIVSKTEAVADAGIQTADTLLKAFVAARVPGLSAIVVPLADAGAKELEALLAEYIPKWLAAAEHEVESLFAELGAKVKALFQKHAPKPLVPPGSPLDLLSDATLHLFYSRLHSGPPLTDDETVIADGGAVQWSGKSIRDNAAGIEWLMKRRDPAP